MDKKIAMMQPYLFPYLGYFQLIAAADIFVLSDDLQYIRGGWVNRNRILDNNEARMITFPLKRDRSDLAINQRHLCDNFADEAGRLINVLTHNYSRAPCFAQVMPLLDRLIRFPQHNLALYIEQSVREICAYLHIDTPIHRACDLKMQEPLDKQDRVIQTAKMFEATLYINPIGGTALYDPHYFEQHDLALRFLKMDDIAYRQYRRPFVSHLSIIDVLMFNDVDKMQVLLSSCSLQTHDTVVESLLEVAAS
ncbi:WbqC family protein [Pseudomonas sp. NPDC087358]|uniref:WbqC family protein n=1 Tax=Pseudomonas sp. NPDC087358 TaxID=3364439 RepID=UPI00384FDFE1